MSRRHDLGLRGPEPAGAEDIDAINRLFSDAFTERYHRDGMTGARVPPLGRPVWRYAIAGAGDGAMLWRDAGGDLAGFTMVHRSGAEGWLGPIAVRPGLQGAGLGTRMVRTAVEWLQRRGATIIGLETMPRTVDNIGFYSRLGFLPGHLTVTLVRDIPADGAPPTGANRLSAVPDREAALAACRALAGGAEEGVDFSRDLELTLAHGLGDATLLAGPGGRYRGFALWHTEPLAMGRPHEEARLLKIVATDPRAFGEVVMAAARHAGTAAPVHRVSVRCQTVFPEAYALLLEEGFQAHWTDLRMTLRDAGERVRPPAVLMSNWEI